MNEPNASSIPRRTTLYSRHVAAGARLVDFAGWEMPIQYRGIVAEHETCRGRVALFDVSHMGRLDLEGTGVAQWLDGLVTRRVTDAKVGRIRYSLVCREDGGVLDDILAYRLPTPEGSDAWSLVVNASNREKLLAWFGRHPAPNVRIVDRTFDTAMIAVQGPRALAVAATWLGWDPSTLAYYTGRIADHPVGRITVGRTGYTGEDGVELIVPAGVAEGVWDRLMEIGAPDGIAPAGLGARDTLRLEAGMPLYGHELTEERNAACAGLEFAIQGADRNFIGRDSIVAAKERGELPVRVGLRLADRRPVREGAEVRRGDATIGVVTSGTFSPTLQAPIAMAYVQADAAAVGSELSVDIRGSLHAARVVELPFYRRSV